MPLPYKSLEVIDVQTVLFFGAWKGTNLPDIANKLIEHSNNRFDGPPMILPVDVGEAPDIPRIILKSKDGSAVLQVSSTRAAFVLQGRSKVALGESEQMTTQLASFMISDLKWVVDRVGRVATHKVTLEQEAISFLHKNLLKQGIADNATQAQVNWLEKSEWQSNVLNRWIRVLTPKDSPDPVVHVTIDTNLAPKPERELTSDQISSFIIRSNELIEEAIEEVFS